MFKLGRLVIPFVFLALIIGIISGLERANIIELNFSFHKKTSHFHFLIFFYGFFGILLTVESSFGQQKKSLLLIPFILLLSLIIYLFSGSWISMAIGAILFPIPSIIIFLKRKEFITFLIPGFLFIFGTFLFVFDKYLPSAVAFLNFIILYILSERLELAKIIGVGKSAFIFFLICEIILTFNSVLTLFHLNFALRVNGLVYLILTVWFWRNDLARKLVKTKEPARFSAISMLLGYFWLCLGNLFFALSPGVFWGEAIHSITLGFVFSMIFAHAPIIFPNIGKFKFKFSKILYLPLAILHLSVLVRVLALFDTYFKPLALYSNFLAILIFFFIFFGIVLANQKNT